MGDNGIYQSIDVFDLTASATIRASYFDVPHPDPVGPYFDGDNWPISTCDYWSIERTSGPGEARVRLTYGNNTCNEVNDFNFLRVARYSGGFWEVPTVLGDAPVSGAVSTIAVTSIFGDFALASDNGFANVLPIELLEFNATAKANSVFTEWITATEVNNDYFTLERSKDGHTFSSLKIIDGAGNSSEALSYSFIDKSPLSGTSYYRLRQTDFDGASTISDPVAVEFRKDHDGFSLENAFNCPEGLCVVYETNSKQLVLRLYSSSGQLVYQSQVFPESNFTTISLDLPRGIYYVSLSDGLRLESRKVLL